MKKFKVAYLIVTRSFPGLLKQIAYDRDLTRDLAGSEWDHFVFLDSNQGSEHIAALPAILRGIFGRKLFAWLWLLRNSRKYDFVIVRHMEFDPFAPIFSWFIPNRVSVHHSKEVQELKLIRHGWKGEAASILERFTGGVAVRTSCALLAVTHEICDYQRKYRRLPLDFPISFFPNGVVVDGVRILGDSRSQDLIEIGFMCGTFAPWHGLDILLNNLIDFISICSTKPSLKIHLIGKLNDEQTMQVDRLNKISGTDVAIAHGRLNEYQYRKILERCHIGIGSLAMSRLNMEEGATLKVREMLAMGLPLYSGHRDTAIPSDFPYYYKGNGDIREILKFSQTVGNAPREFVRAAGRPYIEKRIWIEAVNSFLQSEVASRIHQ